MRLFLSFVFMLAAPCFAQSKLWAKVGSKFGVHLPPAELPQSERRLIASIIVADAKSDYQPWGQDCTVDDLLNDSKWEMIPVSPSHRDLLLQAGWCARGAQGANGAMWIIRLDRGTPVVLASPIHLFSGWIYSIQPSISFGYRDVVLGWHMSAAESNLKYFRFDGKRYRCIGNATLAKDENGGFKIVQAQPDVR